MVKRMKVPNADQPPLSRPSMSVQEASSLLGISVRSAYDAARSGQIPTIRLGKRLVVPTAAIRRMLCIDELDVVDDRRDRADAVATGPGHDAQETD